jgi:hypothetical protein
MKEITESKMNTISATELVNMAAERPLVVKRRGQPLCAVIPLKGEDWESYVLWKNPAFRRMIAKSRRSIKKTGGTSHDEIKKMFNI